MSERKKRSTMENVSKVVERAITKQVRLQEARREFYYFMKKNPEITDESSGDSDEYFKHYNDLEQARTESQQAISDLNDLLGSDEASWDDQQSTGMSSGDCSVDTKEST
jgi:hypothetical protein